MKITSLGWEVANKVQFHQAIDSLSAAVVRVERCSELHCARSQVRDAFAFGDPAGRRFSQCARAAECPGGTDRFGIREVGR
jgi:hypothetical protein